MSEVLHSCRVKAIKSRGKGVSLGAKWAFARRGSLEVMSDSLQCGDWRIPYSEIKDAVLLSMPWLWTKAYVLTVQAGDTTYQFGLNPGAFWQGSLPFPLKREKGGGFWVGVNIVRIVVFAAIVVYLLWSFTR